MPWRTLLELWVATGEAKYRAPMAAAIAWLDKVKLPDGRMGALLRAGHGQAALLQGEDL